MSCDSLCAPPHQESRVPEDVDDLIFLWEETALLPSDR